MKLNFKYADRGTKNQIERIVWTDTFNNVWDAGRSPFDLFNQIKGRSGLEDRIYRNVINRSGHYHEI